MATTRQRTVMDLERDGVPDGRHELIDGELVAMPPAGERHGDSGAGFVARLWLHAVPRGLGRVYGADTGFVLFDDPRTIRVPDAAFVRAERLPADEERDKFLRLAPDLVVEIVSPSDATTDVMTKVLLWLDAGVRLLWLVDPRARSVTVFVADRTPRRLGVGDELDGGEVLPGFRVAVAEVFA